MTPVLASVAAMDHGILGNMAIGTTKWISQDTTSDIKGIVSQIADVPILVADVDFGSSKHGGLRAYETGIVREGVGAGGSVIAAIAKSRGKLTVKQLDMEIERNYERLVEER